MTIRFERRHWIVFWVFLVAQVVFTWMTTVSAPVREQPADGFRILVPPFLEVSVLNPMGWMVLTFMVVGYAFLNALIITELLKVVEPPRSK